MGSYKQACWIVEKICMSETDLLQIKIMYQKLIGVHPWRRLMCNNPGLPKWLFILYVPIHGRLYTKDRMLKWSLWYRIEKYILRLEKSMKWVGEMQRYEIICNGKGNAATIYRMTLVVFVVYELWLERNHKSSSKYTLLWGYHCEKDYSWGLCSSKHAWKTS